MENYIDFFKRDIKNNYFACRESAYKMNEYIKGSTAYYHGEPVKSLYIPKIFSKDALSAMENCVSVTYKIFEKITEKYLKDPNYRMLFPYPKKMEELVLIDRGYKSHIPICRMDIFFNEEDHSFKFCEINTDGTSAMVEDMELNKALLYNSTFNEYKKMHELRTFDLFSKWTDTFLSIYKDWSGSDKKPYVAITDFLGEAYMSDLTHFKEHFENAGCVCRICEITKLKYENGILKDEDGIKIDAIYRRAVTTDIFEHIDEVDDFINAVKDKAVCCIGNFVTQIAHNKALFNIIRKEETFIFLDDEEIEFISKHFPITGYLNSSSTETEITLNDVKASKDRWILKPLDLYGARKIFVGSDMDKESFEKTIDELDGKGYIFQEYCYPYRTDNIDLTEENASYGGWINMTGLYVYDGKLAGLFSRLAPDKVIAGHYGGRTLPTLIEV